MSNSGSPLLAPSPSGADSGIFPEDALGPGEKLVFAARPAFVRGYWGRTLALALLLLFFLAPAGDAPGYIEDPAVWFFLAIPALFLGVVYSQWRHATYALTNQRVVRISGWRGNSVESVPIGDVLSVNSGSSSGGSLFFRYRVPATPNPADPSGYRIKTLDWPAVPNSLGTAARVQAMVSTAQATLRVESVRERTDERIAELTVACPYCGSRASVSLLNSARPTCPFCSAPLNLPAMPPGPAGSGQG